MNQSMKLEGFGAPDGLRSEKRECRVIEQWNRGKGLEAGSCKQSSKGGDD